MKKDVVLLPCQSKRLIAKAILQTEIVQNAYKNNKIIICKGTTNAYILEEFLKIKIDKRKYTTGVVLPGEKYMFDMEKMPDYVINKGVAEEGTLDEFLNDVKTGDLVFKGANAINYAKGTAGILILDKNSGTMGKIFPKIFGKRLNLIIPVGLEKEVSFDLDEVSIMMNDKDADPDMPRMFSLKANLFTEIEAIKTLTMGKVKAYHIATGGVKGAQGAVRLLLDGHKEYVEELIELVKRLYVEDELS
jgi:hypothetical protein